MHTCLVMGGAVMCFGILGMCKGHRAGQSSKACFNSLARPTHDVVTQVRGEIETDAS